MRRVFVALLCGVALLVPIPASAGVDRADAAAGWLARQMVAGERFEVEFDGVRYPDQGLTIDAVFAFAAARASRGYADRALAWLARPEVSGGYLGTGGEAYAGAHAKLLLAVLVAREDPRAFGGVDLVAGLRGLLAPSGRFSDRSAFGDFSTAFSQSFAVIALDRTREGAPVAAVDFLAGTQCSDGGFPVRFGQSPCVGDVDGTAMAVQALLAADRPVDAREGLAWLTGVQQSSGGFGAPANANSTGLAAQALAAGGEVHAAHRARSFLKSLQVGCAGTPQTRGAIAYDASGFDPATAVRATAQAVPGLTGTPFRALRGGGVAGAPTLSC
ncbi:hypothetical protein FHS29_000133 [Saccharothrix tamanrassetensis]|uniref:Peptidase n=1 Tax=Saccharothrix tamanrassetensis TaxID=1051531 RepID=A0A841C9E6_9PSEU|nr:prenyltransferase/squalene oxidase repeat-containing protein [Saccharothrix tamanrassetensis]MBB5953563.1 hypothetical protein [Saccharothrix tamanrassetensis]